MNESKATESLQQDGRTNLCVCVCVCVNRCATLSHAGCVGSVSTDPCLLLRQHHTVRHTHTHTHTHKYQGLKHELWHHIGPADIHAMPA